MRRLGNFFQKDNKTVIVAMDHGLGLDVLPGMQNTADIISNIVGAGVDAVLTGYGMARRYVEELKGTGLILRMDGGNSALSTFQTGNRILDTDTRAGFVHRCLAVWVA